MRPTSEGADIEAAIADAREHLGSLDTSAALAGLQATIAAEEETRARRLLPLLRERLAVERLTYDHDAAKHTLEEITRLAPDDIRARIDLGDLWRVTGSLDRALEAFRQAETAAQRTEDERDLAVSHDRIGDVLLAEGDHEAALKAYRASLAIRDTLTRRDPGNAGWQRNFAVSHSNVGDVLLAEDELEEALKAYRVSLAIIEALTRRDPGNTLWQRDLTVSCWKIADASPPEARTLNARALAIARSLDTAGRLAPTDAWIPAELERRLADRPARPSTPGKTRQRSRRQSPRAGTPEP